MENIIAGTVLAAVPLLFAALGGLIAERTGVLNIGLEGLMLIGALAAAYVSVLAGSGIVGFLGAVALGIPLGLLIGWIMVALRADQVVVGIAFNILALGVTSYLLDVITERRGLGAVKVETGAPTTPIPGLSEIPWIGVIFDQHWIAYIAYLAVPAVFILLFRTGLGVRMRACGEYAAGAQAMGIQVIRMRILAMAASGTLAAAGGAYMVIGDVRVFQQNMTGGRGYIALAVIILGAWRPLGALIAALVFGAAVALSFYVQAQGVDIPSEVIFAMPYIVTLIAVAAFGRRARPPAEDGRPLTLVR